MSEAWKRVGSQVETYLQDYALCAGTAILESEADRTRSCNTKEAIAIGSSIGIANGSCTGTLGGYVRLEKDGAPSKLCGMTCHHVVVEKGVSSPRKDTGVLLLARLTC